MNILFIAPNYLPHIGGVEKHIKNICDEMMKDGLNITILVLKHDNSYEDYEKKGNLEIIRLNKASIGFWNRVTITKYMFLNIMKLVKYDVIHFHDFSTFWSYGLGVYPILKLLGKKVYITFHGWEGDGPPRKSVIVKRKIVEKLASGNICIGHFIEKWYGTKADIVSYGGVKKVDDLSLNKSEYILFVGRLAEDAGIWEYIKVWKVVSKKNSNLKFIICGDGVLRKDIEQYVKENHIKSVIFEGFVADVEGYIKNAKIVFSAGYLGILEAFSYKKNVIAIYDNELKKDYLCLIPNHKNMMWVVDNDKGNIIKAVEEAIINISKKDAAYMYSLENSWGKVKEDYYKLWKI